MKMGRRKTWNIEGTYQTYDEACRAAKSCLLDQDDRFTDISFAEDDKALSRGEALWIRRRLSTRSCMLSERMV
jgi:hypothetical protein